MEVDIEVQRAAEAQDQCDRAGLGRLGGESRLLDHMLGDAAVNTTEHTGPDLRASREQEAQRIGNAQHLLAHRLFGEYLVDEQRGALDHAPSAKRHSWDINPGVWI